MSEENQNLFKELFKQQEEAFMDFTKKFDESIKAFSSIHTIRSRIARLQQQIEDEKNQPELFNQKL